jgi:hydrocephalus-inducing protein
VKGTITFTNTTSGEYLYFDIIAKVNGIEMIDTIALESPVRQSSKRIFTLENPLSGATVMMGSGNPGTEDWWSCDSKAVRVKQLSGFSDNAEGSFEVEYRPYVLPKSAGAQESTLRIISKELGEFRVRLQLTAQPAISRPSLRFEVPLGSQQSETFSFSVFNKTKVDYACSVGQVGVFAVQKSLAVDAVTCWEGDIARVGVSFDPSEVGEKRDVLRIMHIDGGNYECDLVAVCVPPVPQGPYIIASGASLAIPFRNCFTVSSTWNFSIDSPNFRLQVPSATVNAKAEGACMVYFDPKVSGASNTAKLFITCGALSPWVYYLKGNESSMATSKSTDKVLK